MFNPRKLFACTALMASLGLTFYNVQCLPLSLVAMPLAFEVMCDRPNCNSKSDSTKQLPDNK